MAAKQKTTGKVIAIAAAALFSTAPVSASAGSERGVCYGGNACRGLSECKTNTNTCMGTNSCKGKGFKKMTRAECDEVGGDFR